MHISMEWIHTTRIVMVKLSFVSMHVIVPKDGTRLAHTLPRNGYRRCMICGYLNAYLLFLQWW